MVPTKWASIAPVVPHKSPLNHPNYKPLTFPIDPSLSFTQSLRPTFGGKIRKKQKSERARSDSRTHGGRPGPRFSCLRGRVRRLEEEQPFPLRPYHLSPSRMAVSHRPLGSLGAAAPHRLFPRRPQARSWDPHLR